MPSDSEAGSEFILEDDLQFPSGPLTPWLGRIWVLLDSDINAVAWVTRPVQAAAVTLVHPCSCVRPEDPFTEEAKEVPVFQGALMSAVTAGGGDSSWVCPVHLVGRWLIAEILLGVWGTCYIKQSCLNASSCAWGRAFQDRTRLDSSKGQAAAPYPNDHLLPSGLTRGVAASGCR